MDNFDIIFLCFISALIAGGICFIRGYSVGGKDIKNDLLKKGKYRLDDYYVINGSVDKELKDG